MKWYTYNMIKDENDNWVEPEFLDGDEVVYFKYSGGIENSNFLIAMDDPDLIIENFADFNLKEMTGRDCEDFDKFYTPNRRIHYSKNDFLSLFDAEEFALFLIKANVTSAIVHAQDPNFPNFDPGHLVMLEKLRGLEENDINLTNPEIQSSLWYLMFMGTISTNTYNTILYGVPPTWTPGGN